MEEDILKYSPTVMFRGRPCMYDLFRKQKINHTNSILKKPVAISATSLCVVSTWRCPC